jgi:hypothetical protein
VQRLAQQRQDRLAVVRDGELAHPVVRLARRQVVVGVVRAGDEVRRADRLAQVAEADAAARVEQVAHDLAPVRRGGEQRRRGVGDRGAPALHPLVGLARVDGDRRRAVHRRAERAGRLLGQQIGPVPRGHPDAWAVGGRGGGQRGEDGEGEH